ncbi:MAG: M23 family metallopeptidase [Treponema sp.]|nr:M23 family metallopeptidase [Treponema sp.]MCL2250878.1 M23 family metallopeptidase [Treponema sp.]
MKTLYEKSITETTVLGIKSKNLFRLMAFLCLVFLLSPIQYQKQQIPETIDEHGIGGGVLFEEITADANNTEIPLDTDAQTEFADTLSKTRTLLYDSYTVKSGENISTLAVNFGLNQDTIITVNKVTNSRLLQVGKVLKIPNQDGIIHTVRNGETLSAVAEKYKLEPEAIQAVNELFSERIVTGTDLFIPGARLDYARLQEINGDLFIWPLQGALTSYYGYRRDPFNPSRRQFHDGIDISGRVGTPVRAAMAGRVGWVGWDNVFGNYVIINHHSGYRTLYGHLSVIRTRTGAYVAQNERIGDVGNTGLSTGPHLHFTVFKNGATVNPLILMR